MEGIYIYNFRCLGVHQRISKVASIAEGSFVQMTNTLGQVVNVVSIHTNTPIEIDLSQFPPGMLYLRLMSAGECLASEKLLIIK